MKTDLILQFISKELFYRILIQNLLIKIIHNRSLKISKTDQNNISTQRESH